MLPDKVVDIKFSVFVMGVWYFCNRQLISLLPGSTCSKHVTYMSKGDLLGLCVWLSCNIKPNVYIEIGGLEQINLVVKACSGKTSPGRAEFLCLQQQHSYINIIY